MSLSFQLFLTSSDPVRHWMNRRWEREGSFFTLLEELGRIANCLFSPPSLNLPFSPSVSSGVLLACLEHRDQHEPQRGSVSDGNDVDHKRAECS